MGLKQPGSNLRIRSKRHVCKAWSRVDMGGGLSVDWFLSNRQDRWPTSYFSIGGHGGTCHS